MGYDVVLKSADFSFKEGIHGQSVIVDAFKQKFRERYSALRSENIKTLADLLTLMGFGFESSIERCPTCGHRCNEQITNLTQYNGSYSFHDELVFLASYVKSGSWIEFGGEDGDRFRLSFDGKSVKQLNPKLVWEEEGE